MTKPLIGITPDFEKHCSNGEYRRKRDGSPKYNYLIHEAYINAVITAGGMPVILGFVSSQDAGTMSAMLSGLLVTGGGPHIDPFEYGEAPEKEHEIMHKNRFSLEKEMILLAKKKGMPILGICGGEQMLNVIFGGTLHQHISGHQQNEQSFEVTHRVKIQNDSKLFGILGKEEIKTNTHHTQAVKKTANGFKYNAAVVDNLDISVIEGIEAVDGFAIGVQWHPEELDDSDSRKLFNAFISEAVKYQNEKRQNS